MTPTAESNGELEQTALIQQLAHAVEQSPKAFGKDVRVAVGIGTVESPTWLCMELSSTGPGRGVTQDWVPEDMDAALFIPRGTGESMVAGDAALLKDAFQHLLGGQSPLSLRLGSTGSK